jgi:hypothetical protein
MAFVMLESLTKGVNMTETSGTMDELEAMKMVNGALSGLEPEAQARVLRWAGDKFKVKVVTNKPGTVQGDFSASTTEPQEFADLPSLFSAASPSTESECALVVGYWHQIVGNQPDFDAQQINSELKNLGRGVGNITRAFEACMGATPQLVIQTRKSGTSRQARKRYKLTNAGLMRVNEIIARTSGQNQ